jgi:uncharacterized protein (DUF2141 family)
MKPIIYLYFILTTLLGGPTNPAEGVTVTVTLQNVQNDQGEIMAALHTEETFMKGAGVANLKIPAQKGPLTFTFDRVAPGTYAILALHDLNSNQRMDFDPRGMPGEAYGMSGNDMRLGPPRFDSAKFQVGTEDLHLRIRF